ncbi:MAG: hypothetical protein QME49_01410 [bacterium]|nr:hypothetical protein [bacterium]
MKKVFLLTGLLLITKISFGESLILDKEPQLRNWSVRSGHPRLLITADNKQTIVERVKNHYREEFQDILDKANENFNGPFEEWGTKVLTEYNEKDELRDMIERYGFIYQMGQLDGFNYYNRTAEQYGREGVRALLAMKPEINWTEWNTIADKRVRIRYTGFALGYDWLYSLLTNEQKTAIIYSMIENNHFAFCPDDYKPSDKTGIGNFPRCKENISGFAFMNDGINDNAARSIIEQLYTGKRTDGQSTGLLSGGALDLLKMVCGDGITIDGMTYMVFHKGYIPFLEAWYTATGQDYFKITEFYKNLPLWIAYSIQPATNYSLFRVQCMRAPFRLWNNCKWDASSLFSGIIGPLNRADTSMARLCKWIVEELLKGDVYEPLIYKIIMGGDPQITKASPKGLSLPLNKRFEKHGWVSMRSDWENEDATFATFMCHTYQFNRIGLFSNSFTIWKNRGPLLFNRGWGDHNAAFGDFTDSWNSFLFINNSLLKYDSNGRQMENGEDGFDAQKFIPSNDFWYKTGGIKYFETRQGKYNYIYGDASKAYLCKWRRPHIDECRVLDIFTRQFIYFCGDNGPAPESDYFIVFDRVKTKHAETEKHMLLQMNYDPMIIKDNWDINQQISGENIAGGKWKYNNPHHFVITNAGYNNAHGKAFVKTLLPENTTVYKIGGQGHQFNDWYGNDPRNSALGVNYTEPLTDEQKFYWGEYRLHIVPTSTRQEDIFLHAIEATDASHTTPVSMEKISSNSVVGARIGQYIALFNTKEEFLLNGQAFLPYNGQFNILVADLEPQRQYCVTLDKATSTLNASDAGCIYLDGVTLNNSTLIVGTTTLEPDNIPPDNIKDFGIATVTNNSVVLTWTASGDDNMTGQAMRYDGRYSTSSITTENWDNCLQFSLTSPKEAGHIEFGTVTGLLPNTTYYFAIRAVDEQNNWSTFLTPLVVNTPVLPVKRLLCDFGQRNREEPDDKIDFEDLMWFALYWNTKNLCGDIAGSSTTTSGNPPDMVTQPDGKVNFEDLMIFAQMWNWWHETIK